MNAYSKTKSTSGNCGCGGSKSGSPAAGCECGSAGCATCKGQGYTRPNFFAGQLLTEEDLQLLSDYVAAKNRLHNRHLFGEGVVCGLEVTCHPCGEGRVTVRPGYALDCCGNDIVLACEQTLDITGMIRDLRISKLGGIDCGDPCKDKETPKNTDAASGAATTTGETPKDKTAKPEDVTRHYCLYIRYCEELSDPVSPYSTGDACASVACQPTRVREGVRFELRCREDHHHQSDLICNLLECLSDVTSDRSRIINSRTVLAYTSSFAAAEDRNTIDMITFRPAQVADLTTATANLDKQLREIATLPKDEETVWAAVEATRNLASLVARHQVFNALNPVETPPAQTTRAGKRAKAAEQPTEAAEVRPAEKAVDVVDRQAAARAAAEAMKVLEVARAQLADKVTEAVPLEIDREHANALFSVIGNIQTGQINNDVQEMAQGFVSTVPLTIKLSESLVQMREHLLDRLEQAEHLTDCSLPRELASLSLSVTAPSESDIATGKTFSTTSLRNDAAKFVELYKRYLLNCICSALLPPCQPCDDTGVLLACLEVKDCDVVRVCNLERTFVLSPTAIRYWIPFRLLGEEIEALCCGRPLFEAHTKGRDAASLQSAGFIPSTGLSQNLIRFSTGASRLSAGEFIAGALAKLCGTPEDARRYMLVINSLRRFFAQPDFSIKSIGETIATAQSAAVPPAAVPPSAAPPVAQPVAPVDAETVKVAVSEFLNRATFDETTEFGRSVLAKVDALVAEKMAAQPVKGKNK